MIKKMLMYSLMIMGGALLCACPSSPELPRTFETLVGIDQYVRGTIRYEWDTFDEWQTPEETLARGAGDCEDMAILWLYIAEKSGFGKGVMGLYRSENWSRFHAVAELDGHKFNVNPEVNIWCWNYGYDVVMGLSVVKEEGDVGYIGSSDIL